MLALRDVELAVAATPLAVSDLNPRERTVYRSLPRGTRRREWLIGRRALRKLGPLGDPLRGASLTYAGGVAVAVAARSHTDRTVGVDMERRRTLHERHARFFLTDRERDAAGPDDLVRLWTVKEAVFKAHRGHNEADVLLQYEVDEPLGGGGCATAPDGCRFAYLSTQLASGFITIAMTEGDAPC